MSSKPTIFVNVVAYRDAEAYPTIASLFEKAHHPENLHIGLCWQYSTLSEAPFEPRDRKNQVSVINMDYKKAKGACWARHTTQKLYNDETYYLQVDGHSRFIPHWDTRMIEELARCPSEKPMLSTYPNVYTLPNVLVDNGPHKLAPKGFENGVPVFQSFPCSEEDKRVPHPAPVATGGFTFTKAQAILDVPYDPFIYFIGEEITMSARYWTHGYDMFTPTRAMVFHLYDATLPTDTEPKSHHWDDHADWYDKHERHARERVHHLLGITSSTNPLALRDIEKYGMGTVRDLAQYQHFTGIDFKTQTYSENARQGIFTPL